MTQCPECDWPLNLGGIQFEHGGIGIGVGVDVQIHQIPIRDEGQVTFNVQGGTGPHGGFGMNSPVLHDTFKRDENGESLGYEEGSWTWVVSGGVGLGFSCCVRHSPWGCYWW